MQVVENVLRLENPVPNLSLTIGSFDGVHLGHRSLLAALFEESREAGGPSGVMILKPHPRQFFSPESAPNLLTCDTQQRRLLEEAGVDYLFILPFCASVACADRWDFLSGIVVGRCGTRRLVVGHDFRFGRGARGNYEYLLESAPELGLRVRQVDALVIKGQCVSSTLIRELVISGEMEQIPKWLGRRYAIEGTVVRGRGIGAGIGFPTANVEPCNSALPAHGVYAAEVILDGTPRPAAVNIGIAPTIRQDEMTIEAHLIDYQGDLLEKTVEVVFHHRLRPEKKYPSVAELVRAIGDDVNTVREYFRAF